MKYGSSNYKKDKKRGFVFDQTTTSHAAWGRKKMLMTYLSVDKM